MDEKLALLGGQITYAFPIKVDPNHHQGEVYIEISGLGRDVKHCTSEQVILEDEEPYEQKILIRIKRKSDD